MNEPGNLSKMSLGRRLNRALRNPAQAKFELAMLVLKLIDLIQPGMPVIKNVTVLEGWIIIGPMTVVKNNYFYKGEGIELVNYRTGVENGIVINEDKINKIIQEKWDI